MNRKIEVRYKIYRMLCVLYSLELMDWDTWDATYDAAEVACDAYYKGLKEVRNEK